MLIFVKYRYLQWDCGQLDEYFQADNIAAQLVVGATV